MPVFTDGTAKDMLSWVLRFDKLCKLQQWDAKNKHQQLYVLLGTDLQEILLLQEEQREDNDTHEEHFQATMEAVISQHVPDNYGEILEEELWQMRKKKEETVQQFSRRFREVLRYIKVLPHNTEYDLPESTLMRAYKRSMPMQWQNQALMSGQSFYRVDDYIQYFGKLEQTERNMSTPKDNSKQGRNSNRNPNRNNVQKNQSNQQNGKKDKQERTEKWCSHHKTKTHDTKECRALKEENNKLQAYTPTQAEIEELEQYLNTIDLAAEFKLLDSKQQPLPPNDFKYLQTVKTAPTLRPFRIPIELEEQTKLYALVDSGCSKSLINEKIKSTLQEMEKPITPSGVRYTTADGDVYSDGQVTCQFKIPSAKPHETITHTFEILKNSSDEMIIGRDLLSALGMILNFKDLYIEWDGSKIPVCIDTVLPDEEKELESQPTPPKEANSVKPSDLTPPWAENPEAFIELLTRYQQLYDGRLGKMRFPDYILPIDLHYKPIHAKPYPIPRSQMAQAQKEIDKLIALDVLEQIYGSEIVEG